MQWQKKALPIQNEKEPYLLSKSLFFFVLGTVPCQPGNDFGIYRRYELWYIGDIL
jgi:hypothetical protein